MVDINQTAVVPGPRLSRALPLACISFARQASGMMAACNSLAALCEYLRALAEHFDLRKHIRCNMRLVRLERRSTGDTGAL
jgi:hypothetical protein